MSDGAALAPEVRLENPAEAGALPQFALRFDPEHPDRVFDD